MITKIDKNADRKKRHLRVRKKIRGTADCPRMNVYRSANHIYVQLIDDDKGNTLCSASTTEKDFNKNLKTPATKSDEAFAVGQAVAKRAIEKNIKKVVFDRGGYLYMGRIQRLAEGARQAGLEF